MAKRRRRNRDIWFHGRWWYGYMPVRLEGLVLTFVALPVGAALVFSGDWLAKQGFDPWVGMLSFGAGVVVIAICLVLYFMHLGFDPDL